MSRASEPFIADILEACGKVSGYIAGMSFEAFTSDSRTFDAVVRNLEIIGEAVKQLPEEFTAKHPEIEWRRIARFRDMLIHHYFRVDAQIVWEVATVKVPELAEALSSPGPAATE
jgi:uncharacterized protein with HEPN domain